MAALHVRDIPYGDLAKLGPRIVGEVYHGILLSDPDFVDAVSEVDGELAGSSAANARGLLGVWIGRM